MDHILSLITDPARADLDEPVVAAVRDVLRDLGAHTGPPDWLAEGVAWEMPFSGTEAETVLAAVRARLAGARLDVVVLPAHGRRKKLLVADMESTIIENEMVDDLAAYVGARDRVAEITRRAMNGEIAFRPALRQRVALLAGLDTVALAEACARIRFVPGARALVRTMRANGARTALVSGGFQTFSAHVREVLGFERDLSNRLEIRDGRLTGRLIEPVLGREAKLEAMCDMAAELEIGVDEVVAVGDGANDLPMLQTAGMGIAFHAKPAVASAIPTQIDHGDLTAVLYLQGYRNEEIVR